MRTPTYSAFAHTIFFVSSHLGLNTYTHIQEHFSRMQTHPDCLHRVVKADIATLRASSTSSVDIDGLSSEQLLLAARDGLLPASMVEYHLPDMIACLRHAKGARYHVHVYKQGWVTCKLVGLCVSFWGYEIDAGDSLVEKLVPTTCSHTTLTSPLARHYHSVK